jgi:WD40 repeat protein
MAEDEEPLSYVENAVEERAFEITTINRSGRFASFKLELSTPGQSPDTGNSWYSVEPTVSAKIPSGNATTFRVVVTRPPILAVNTTLDLSVHIFSDDYDDLEATCHLDLAIEQQSQSLQVHLVTSYLKAYPGDRTKIEALVMNFRSEPVAIKLALCRLPQEWFTSSTTPDASGSRPTELHHTLAGGDTKRLAFYCILPNHSSTISKIYDFDVEISDQRNIYGTTHGHIEVLPAGMVNFGCETRQQILPHTSEILPLKRSKRRKCAIFPLTFTNYSNLTQQINVHAAETSNHNCTIKLPNAIELEPEDEQTVYLEVCKQRPWWGWERRLLVDLTPDLVYPNVGSEIRSIYLKPSSHNLDIRVRPIVPLWLQIGGGLLMLLLIAWWWLLRPVIRHTAPVTTVQIVGPERTIVTGSRDQSVYQWEVRSILSGLSQRTDVHNPQQIASSESLERAVRVVRASPSDDQNRVAIGLENGEIRLWDIDSGQAPRSIADTTDRVFALAFTPNAQQLFSGHGSGSIRQWNVSQGLASAAHKQLYLGNYSVADIDVLTRNSRSLVVIGASFNRFVVWDWRGDIAFDIPYEWSFSFDIEPVISRFHLITDIEVNSDIPLVATADNTGIVTIWDGNELMDCTADSSRLREEQEAADESSNSPIYPFPCASSAHAFRLDQWQASTDGVAVRSMALSENGCYLATATADGSIDLWSLNTTTGERLRSEPIQIHHFQDHVPYEIDIRRRDTNHLLIAVDAPGNRVHLFEHKIDIRQDCSL